MRMINRSLLSLTVPVAIVAFRLAVAESPRTVPFHRWNWCVPIGQQHCRSTPVTSSSRAATRVLSEMAGVEWKP